MIRVFLKNTEGVSWAYGIKEGHARWIWKADTGQRTKMHPDAKIFPEALWLKVICGNFCYRENLS